MRCGFRAGRTLRVVSNGSGSLGAFDYVQRPANQSEGLRNLVENGGVLRLMGAGGLETQPVDWVATCAERQIELLNAVAAHKASFGGMEAAEKGRRGLPPPVGAIGMCKGSPHTLHWSLRLQTLGLSKNEDLTAGRWRNSRRREVSALGGDQTHLRSRQFLLFQSQHSTCSWVRGRWRGACGGRVNEIGCIASIYPVQR